MVMKLTTAARASGAAGGVNEWMFGCMLRQQAATTSTGDRPVSSTPKRASRRPSSCTSLSRRIRARCSTRVRPAERLPVGKIACIWAPACRGVHEAEHDVPGCGRARAVVDRPNVLSFARTSASSGRHARQVPPAGGSSGGSRVLRASRVAQATSYVPARRSSLELPRTGSSPARYRAFFGPGPADYVSFEPKTEAWFSGRRLLGEALEKVMRARPGAAGTRRSGAGRGKGDEQMSRFLLSLSMLLAWPRQVRPVREVRRNTDQGCLSSSPDRDRDRRRDRGRPLRRLGPAFVQDSTSGVAVYGSAVASVAIAIR